MTFLQKPFSKTLRRLHFVLLQLQRRALLWPKVTLVLFCAFFLIGMSALPKLKMLLLMDDLIDPDFQTYQELKDLNKNFSDKNNVYVIVRPRTGNSLNKATLCDLQSWMQSLVKDRSDLVKILSSFGVRKATSADNKVSFQPLLQMNCGQRDLDESVSLKNGFQELAASPWGPVLTSLRADDVLINIFIANTLHDSRTGDFDVQIVEQLMTDFDQKVGKHHPEIKPLWSGIASFQYYLKQGYDQTGLLNLLTAIVIFIVFRVLFKTWISGFLFLFSYLFALVPTYGGMAYFKAPIDVLSNSLALMVLIASIEDFLFIGYLQMKEQRSWRRPFRQLLLPSFFTSFTTMLGFVSLVTADFSIIRRFGMWAGVAAMLEFFMVFIFLPALLKTFPRLRKFTRGELIHRLAWVEKLKEQNLPRAFGFVALSVFFISAFGFQRLYVSDAPEKVFPKSHPVRQTVFEVEKSRGWQTEISLVFHETKDRDRNQKVLHELSLDPMVKAVENPYLVEEYIRGTTRTALKNVLSSLWADSTVSKRLMNPDSEESRAILYLTKTDIVDVNQLRDKAVSLCAGRCHLAGTLVSYGEFGQRVLSTLMGSLALSLVLVSLVLLFLIIALNQNGAIPLLLSAMWGPVTLLAIFITLKIPVFYVTSIFASILVGLAGDNTIQYLFANHRGHYSDGIRKMGGASILLTIAMSIIACVLFGSVFEPMKILGVLMITGFIFSLLGDLWLLKSFSNIFPEQRIFSDLISKIFQKK